MGAQRLSLLHEFLPKPAETVQPFRFLRYQSGERLQRPLSLYQEASYYPMFFCGVYAMTIRSNKATIRI